MVEYAVITFGLSRFSFSCLWHFCKSGVLGSKKNFLKNFSQKFGKIALLGVIDSERKIRGFGKLPNKQNAGHFRKRVLFSYACYETFLLSHYERTGKEWKGKERLKTAVLRRKRVIRCMKQLLTKSAVPFMKYLQSVVVLNCSMTKWNGL